MLFFADAYSRGYFEQFLLLYMYFRLMTDYLPFL